jgi:hypothetical protein
MEGLLNVKEKTKKRIHKSLYLTIAAVIVFITSFAIGIHKMQKGIIVISLSGVIYCLYLIIKKKSELQVIEHGQLLEFEVIDNLGLKSGRGSVWYYPKVRDIENESLVLVMKLRSMEPHKLNSKILGYKNGSKYYFIDILK